MATIYKGKLYGYSSDDFIYGVQIEICWGDLTEKTQNEIRDVLGSDIWNDDTPMAIVEIEEDKHETA